MDVIIVKICFVASSGGHIEELQTLECFKERASIFYITEKVSTVQVSESNVYYLPQINRRELLFLPKLFYIFVKGMQIIGKEKPDCYISNGALLSIPILLLGKMLGKKIIFIETLARVESGSLSGKIAYRFADLFIVHWKKLLDVYPQAVYITPFEELKDDICSRRNTEVPV